ncbi:LTA synthase family protein [Neptunomonas marina]|uniref:LTA synthase family protein n=1 Tax=Neptunomonas marina TaxID=1815562 RepID=A0A437QDS3_9GAMM|nr:LTA synthase family protein [Neptunomonas marina]RVU32661.1 LTA synthase family protein [Neptunomonas marina]
MFKRLKISSIFSLIAFAIFLALLYFSIDYRILELNETFSATIGCDGCFKRSIALHDLLFFGVVLLLTALSFVIRVWFVSIALRLLSSVLLIGYWADVFIMREFFTRLNLADVKRYGTEPSLVLRHIENTGLLEIYGPYTALMIAGATFALLMPARGFSSLYKLACVFALVMIGASFFVKPTSYVHDWGLVNYVQSNMAAGVSEPYSTEREVISLAEHNKARTQLACRGESPMAGKNIILLILESWSPYQSELLSGIRDWTPHLDKLAKDNTYFTQMYASGFSTNEGLMSLLAGNAFLSPIKSFHAVRPFETAWKQERTLPLYLSEAGYHTRFITNGNLKFSHKGKWLNHIGFDQVDGHDLPLFTNSGQRRLHFDAVPDALLYEAALQHARSADQPYFMVLENVSTHHPYIQPETLERSQELVFRYMDNTVANFYEALEGINFFENGVLMIVSDHRAMIPMTKHEIDIFGRAAASRIPAIIVEKGRAPTRIDRPVHQSDLVTSFAACNSDSPRSWFHEKGDQDACLFHARGDSRDVIDVFCPAGHGSIVLAGENSRFRDSEGLSEDMKQALLDEVAYKRIVGDYQHAKYLESR